MGTFSRSEARKALLGSDMSDPVRARAQLYGPCLPRCFLATSPLRC